MPSLEDVKQGIEVIYRPEKPSYDIVAVPGLGANPSKCWESLSSHFNWLAAKDGLQKEFPDARILLYRYESAWKGPLHVKQSIKNAAWGLLWSLKGERENAMQRPIVFIGHSMGGLVVAKAVCLAESRIDRVPQMYETIAGCLFLGTPFKGADAAYTAMMWAEILQKWDKATPNNALDILQPKNQALEELREEFIRVANKLKSKVEIFCVFEEQPTDFAKEANMGLASPLLKMFGPKKLREPLVSKESATLDGHEMLGMACAHRHLNRFESNKDGRYVMLREPLRNMVHSARRVVKGRMNATREGGVDDAAFASILENLDGCHVSKIRKSMTNGRSAVSWVLNEQTYRHWAGCSSHGAGEHLWICGSAGKGKSMATLAAIESIEDEKSTEQKSGRPYVLLAYFLCDSTPQTDNAESLLRSLLSQLIYQRRLLAQYARQFMKDKTPDAHSGKPATAGSQAKLTVENLWRSLQDMLTDDCIETVYFVINNLHEMSEDAESTTKFLDLLGSEFSKSMQNEPSKHVKWLISSKKRSDIEEKLAHIPRIDLNDAMYDEQRQQDLTIQAQAKVTALSKKKNYGRALTYFIGITIEDKAENALWVDVTCMQLEMLPPDHIMVRTKLDKCPEGLKELLNLAWLSVLNPSHNGVETLKEILRTLLLTYEDPTEAELSMLAGLSHVDQDPLQRLRSQVKQCHPLITTQNERVRFLNKEVKEHLSNHSERLLSFPRKNVKSQHGILALRCFDHVVQIYSKDQEFDDSDSESDNDDEDWYDSDDEGTYTVDDDLVEEEPVVDGDDPQKALKYADRYWLNHAKDATSGIARLLSCEEDFWKADSRLRSRWLKRYNELTGDFDDFARKGLRALHVVSAIGYAGLVIELLNSHSEDLHEWDKLGNQPLHYAAAFGQDEIIEELLEHGANIDDGKETKVTTPLYMAAVNGNIKTMEKLIHRGAATDAIDETEGPALNGAVLSGNIEVVKTLFRLGDPRMMYVAIEGTPSRLAVAAHWADTQMVEFLLDEHGDGFGPADYEQALVEAAFSGNEHILNRVLRQHRFQNPDTFQNALDEAATESQWAAVKIILQQRRGLSCEKAFCKAAEEGLTDMMDELNVYTGRKIPMKTLNEALYVATDMEQEQAVLLLLDTFGASPEATGEGYGNALTASANDGTVDILRALLNKGADPNALSGWALQIAAFQGHADIVTILLEHYAHPDHFNHKYEPGTAIQAACNATRTEIVEMLLKAGANPNLGQGSFSPPVSAAAHKGEAEILKLLVEAGADVNVTGGPDNDTVLNDATAMLPVDSIAFLIDKGGADVNAVGANSSTPLIVAAWVGDKEAAALLLDRGANLAYSSPVTGTALHSAAAGGNIDCISLLLDRGANIFTLAPTTAYYDSVLSAAITYRQHKSVARILDALRAAKAPLPMPRDPATRGTVMHIAAATPDKRCLAQLLDYTVDDTTTTTTNTPPALINAIAGSHSTPLQAACFAACHRNVRLLLDRGAKPGITGSGKHDSALQAAALKCNRATVEHLLETLPGGSRAKAALVVGMGKRGLRGKYGSALGAAAVRSDGTEVLEFLLGQVRVPRAAKVAMEMAVEWGRKEAFEVVRESEVGRKVASKVVEELEARLEARLAEMGDGGEERVNSDFEEDGGQSSEEEEDSDTESKFSDDDSGDDEGDEDGDEIEGEGDDEKIEDDEPTSRCHHCGK